MTTWRRSRLWVGALALLAPLPLPFNEMALWPVTLLYLVATAGWVAFVWRGADPLLRPWVLNLLGGLYLPVLLVDLAAAQGGQVLRPLVHVAMFATAAKLFALRSERDKWHALVGAFFLFIAGMGSSVHPALVAHMVVFSTVAIAGLIHFAEAHSQRPFPTAGPIPGKRALVSGIVTVTVVGCAVLFPLLPRVTQPYVAGGGSSSLGGAGGLSAFTEDLTLDSIGRVRSDRSVALRLVFDGPIPDEIRLKASTYDLYRDQRWLRTQGTRFLRARSGWVDLVERAIPRGEVDVFSRLSGSPMMPILTQAVIIESNTRWIGRSPGGDIRPLRWRGTPLRYRMSYGTEPRTLADSPPNPETLDRQGITQGIADYAARFLSGPEASIVEVAALERHLQDDFDYSLDLNLDPANPVEDFLLRERSGHCEYFASSLVLMLRSQGIPARVVSGFLGAEGNPLEAFYVVRNANAHAWVEAWVEGGWRILDPTPAAARPRRESRGSTGLWQHLMDAYDWIVYRWDRYVLTFSSEDQSTIFTSMWTRLQSMWAELWGGEEETQSSFAATAPAEAETITSPPETEIKDAGWRWTWWLLAGVVSTLAAGVVVWWRLRRGSGLTATAIYVRLREAAPKIGIEADETSAPARVVDTWARLEPDVAGDLRLILDAYLEESFGGRRLEREECEGVEEGWQRISGRLSRAA